MAAIRRCAKQQSIEAYVMERIRAGRLKPGDKAPSNVELARRFGVSTVTATTALSALAARGLVERRRGAGGTVVAGRLGRMGTVAFVMPPFMVSFFWRIFVGATDVLTARGYAT
ncbi:MAG: GntR family transcriptional regulator, partial [Kiritimatiellae bacterium]|nr:GntR family transcriptional regulator [Kiritimatiellia bacterium]